MYTQHTPNDNNNLLAYNDVFGMPILSNLRMYILVQIVGRVLRSMQSEHGGAASIEDRSEYLLMALKEALALVGPIKCS